MTTFQVGHWTLDNAANNGTFMEHLEILLCLWDIDFDAEDWRIMCFPHIINICCQHIIKDFTNVELVDAAVPTQTPSPSNTLSYEEAVKCDPVAHGRNVVHVLRAFGQRRDSLLEIINDSNAKGWFRIGNPPTVIQLRPLQLLHDVKIWWDTVYFMIKHLRDLHPISFNCSDLNFTHITHSPGH